MIVESCILKYLNYKMTEDQLKLLDKIEKFQLDDPFSSFTFSERLARENNWSLEFALRAIEEYKRFIFLICSLNHPLTPSDQVDQVWHLHLLYTESYWIEFCQKTIGKQIHHGPTKGGKGENEKFTDWYLKTKNSYFEIFKELPPDDIWPNSEVRFKRINFKRIEVDQYWIIKKIFK